MHLDKISQSVLHMSAARANMVDGQLKPSNIRNALVIDAMASVPREDFVPQAYAALAYMDADVPVSEAGSLGRRMMQPRVLARLIDLAEVREQDKVLIVGTMSGYSAAVMALLARSVVAIEDDEKLVVKAAEHLGALSHAHVSILRAPLESGYSAKGPYDVILFDGALGVTPDAFFDQLAEGGRLVCVIQDGSLSRASVFTRADGAIGSRPAFDARIAPLPGFVPAPVFQF